MRRIVLNVVTIAVLSVGPGGNVRADDSPGNRRIVGGEATTIEKHPWQVALNIKGLDGKTYLCGGSLINQRWILTAAHCVPTADAGATRVKAGVTDYIRDGNWLEVERVIPHASYNAGTSENDIALIKLKAPYAGKSVALAGSATALANSVLEVTGWGATSEGGAGSRKLLVAKVPYVENSTCNEPASYNNAIKQGMLCAGAKGVDSCQGDSGGPLVLHGTSGPVLVGVVSVGEGCARELKYGVYTRVSSYRDWIDATLRAGGN